MLADLRLGVYFKKLLLRIKSVFIRDESVKNQIQDYQIDLDKHFDNYIEANEKYLQVANKFFSTSIEEDQKSLIKSAEGVLYHHAAAQFFTMVESINIFKKAANKIIASSEAISELIVWIEERQKENSEMAEKLANRKSDVGLYPIVKRLFIEQNFLDETKLYLIGIFRVLLAYFKYTFESSFKELPMPALLEQFQKRHRASKLWLVLPFIGLILNFLGFIPIISVVTGIIGIVMFVIENYYLDGKELINLKKMPSLAQQAQAELKIAKDNIDAVRNIRDFIVSLDAYLPQDTVRVIDSLKMRMDVDPKILEAQRELLIQRSTANHNRTWPGIGALSTDNSSNQTADDLKSLREKHKRKYG